MSVIFSPESGYAKERIKYEAQNSEMGPGQRPYVHREYPTWMFLGGIPQGEVGATRIVDQRICQEEEVNNLASRGWRTNPIDAIKAYDAQKLEEAKLAAEIEFEIAKGRVTENAAKEIRAAQAEVDGHLAMVPETPVRHRIAKALEGGAKLAGAKE